MCVVCGVQRVMYSAWCDAVRVLCVVVQCGVLCGGFRLEKREQKDGKKCSVTDVVRCHHSSGETETKSVPAKTN